VDKWRGDVEKSASHRDRGVKTGTGGVSKLVTPIEEVSRELSREYTLPPRSPLPSTKRHDTQPVPIRDILRDVNP
jgi:hypothetical protein